MEVASPRAANGHTASPTLSSVISPNAILQHLVHVLEVTLGASVEDLERPGSLLSSPRKHDTLQRCRRFASEGQVALYVSKDFVDFEKENKEVNGKDGSFCISI